MNPVNINDQQIKDAEEFLNRPKTNLIKSSIVEIGSGCAGFLVNRILKNCVGLLPGGHLATIGYRIGGLAIGTAVGRFVSRELTGEIDDIEETVKKFKIELGNTQKNKEVVIDETA